jgi:hypothetical protein
MGRVQCTLAVVLRVKLACLVAVMLGMDVVRVRDVGVMRGLLMVAGVVGLRGLAVVPRGMIVVLCRLVVMLQFFFVGHDAVVFEVLSPGLGTSARLLPDCFISASVA